MSNPAQAPQPILSFTWTMSQPDTVNESLSVYSDGSVWYWSLTSASVKMRHRAGTFTFQLPDPEFADLQKLAAELTEAQSEGANPARGTIAIHVTGYHEGKSQTYLLSANAADTDTHTPAMTRAYELGHDLMRRAEDAPLAVVRFDWQPVSDVVQASQASHVNFTFENPGIEPVLLSANLDDYALYRVESNGASTRIWQGKEGFGTGIRSSRGGVKEGNGALTPATIKPGTTSIAFFRDALLFDQQGKIRIGAAVRGKIAIYYPAGSAPQQPNQFPDWPFYMETQPRQVVIAG